MTTEHVDLTTAATMLRKTPNTLKRWFKLGCPVVAEGAQNRPWQVCIADVVEWLEQRAAQAATGDTSALDIDEARRRKVAAEAALAELDLACRRGELIEAATVEAVWSQMLANFRTRALAVPTRAAPLVAGGGTLREMQEILRAVVYEALTELSEYDATQYADDA
jgi:terminase small subunit / prophage DNA-packing protein